MAKSKVVVEDVAGEAVVEADVSGSAGSAPGEPEQPESPATIPTREDIRAMVKERLDAGVITQRDILVDLYASQYAVELSLREFQAYMAGFANSRIGRMFIGKVEKEARRRGADQGAEGGG